MTRAATLKSMTGFARVEGGVDECTWVWEAKCVNAKGLDFRCRLSGFETIEKTLRDHVFKSFLRGNFSVTLTVIWVRPAMVYRINEEILSCLKGAVQNLRGHFPDSPPVSFDGLLAVNGIVESKDEGINPDRRAAIEQIIIKDFREVIKRLAESRSDEGIILGKVLGEQLKKINKLRSQAERLASSQSETIRKLFEEQLRVLMKAAPALPEERIAQEVTLLILKADVQEELDRLGGHCESAAALLIERKGIGRRLDFLCQELNREVNTLCSKSRDIELTRVGLGMKASIEQMREQVQNVE